MRVVLSKKL